VIPKPTAANTAACVQNPASGTAARDRHDFGRQDEVGPDRAVDHFAFDVVGILPFAAKGVFVLVRLVRPECLEEFFRALIAEIDAADHQKRRDRPRGDKAKNQGGRQQNEQLVSQRSGSDLGN
jgi:hypothetical protein